MIGKFFCGRLFWSNFNLTSNSIVFKSLVTIWRTIASASSIAGVVKGATWGTEDGDRATPTSVAEEAGASTTDRFVLDFFFVGLSPLNTNLPRPMVPDFKRGELQRLSSGGRAMGLTYKKEGHECQTSSHYSTEVVGRSGH